MRPGRFLSQTKGLVSADRCRELIEQANEVGFQAATVSTPAGPQSLTMVRNNSRAEWTDSGLAAELWPPVRSLLGKDRVDDARPIALSDRWKVYRYVLGERFNAHRDGTVRTDDGSESRLTVLIVLQKPDRGGGTLFFADRSESDPRRGMLVQEVFGDVGDAIVFDHKWWHAGQRVVEGEKMVLRTDVLFRM